MFTTMSLVIEDVLGFRNAYAATGKAFVKYNDVKYIYEYAYTCDGKIRLFSEVETPLTYADERVIESAVLDYIFGIPDRKK